MLQKQTHGLLALINHSQSIIFLLNDIQHQSKKTLSPHETLPAIIAQLDLYKKLVLSPAQIIELQSIAENYGLHHAFLYEPPTGIITKELKESFLNELQKTIKTKIHQTVKQRVIDLVSKDSAQDSVPGRNNALELYTTLISSCSKAIQTLVSRSTAEDIPSMKDFKVLTKKLCIFARVKDHQLNIADIMKALVEIVRHYPRDLKPELKNIAFDEAKNLINLIEVLNDHFLEFRSALEHLKTNEFSDLIKKYGEVENNPIYQVATALEELPKIKRIIEERCPAEMKKASVAIIPPIGAARGLTSGAATNVLAQSEEVKDAITLAKQLLEQIEKGKDKQEGKVLLSVPENQRPKLTAAWEQLIQWGEAPFSRRETLTSADLTKIFDKFELAPAKITATFNGR